MMDYTGRRRLEVKFTSSEVSKMYNVVYMAFVSILQKKYTSKKVQVENETILFTNPR